MVDWCYCSSCKRSVDYFEIDAEFTTDRICVLCAKILREQFLESAEEVVVTPEQYDEFVEVLDRPVQEKPELRKLLETPAPWE